MRNAGKKWKKSHDIYLKARLDQGWSIEDIASKLGRSTGSIEARVRVPFEDKYYNKVYSVDEITEKILRTKLKLKYLEDQLQRVSNKKYTKPAIYSRPATIQEIFELTGIEEVPDDL